MKSFRSWNSSNSLLQPPWPGWAVVVGLLLGVAIIPSLARSADPGALLKEARLAFEHGHYDRVLALLEPLTHDKSSPVETSRLTVMALLKLGRPVEALDQYDRLRNRLDREDRLLLREVAIGFILPLLKDMRVQMRGAAFTALKAVDSDGMIPYFEDGLSDGSGLVRALAVEGLGRLKAGRLSPRLRKALEDQAALVRVAALKALGRSGDRSVRSLVEKALLDEQATVRVAAAGALVGLGQTSAWSQIERAAHAAHPDERAAALRAMGELQDKRALPILLEALHHVQPSVRGAAAAALGDFGKPDGVKALTAVLKDPVPAVRLTAAVSLGSLHASTAVPALKQMLDDPNPFVRGGACSALLQLGAPYENIGEIIRGLAQDSDPGVRAFAARVLSKSHGGNTLAAISQLRLLLHDSLPRPRIAAARALGQIGQLKGTDVMGMLKAALRDPDEAVRATAGGAIRRILLDSGGNQGVERL